MSIFSLLRGSAAAIGLLLVMGLTVFVIRLDYFASLAANKILANAVSPESREPPPTPGAIPYSSSDIQVIGGRGDGLSCSLPPILEWLAFPGGKTPIGIKMHQACAFHDYCYRHGAATYGYTQADCDFLLQEHAFRLCKFTAPETLFDLCLTEARLITLGVRVGGSDAFRPTAKNDEDGTSTYFEFDPYPRRTEGFVAYRVTDRPSTNPAPGQKALYRFTIRPSGIRVAVSEGLSAFRPFGDVPGSPRHMVSAPIVVTEFTRGYGVDWFVWWQRQSMDSTGGRLVAFSPAFAAPSDLECLAKQSALDGPDPCFARSPSVLAALVGKKHPDDPNFSEIVAADDAGEWSQKGLSLMVLRVHSCSENENANVLCITHVVVDPRSGALVQRQEPLIVRDRITGSDSNESGRYQNFAMLPFVVTEDSPRDPVLIWAKRLATDHVKLRRAGVDRQGTPEQNEDDESIALGTVQLEDFAEGDEPLFILDRAAKRTVIASLVAGSDGVKVRVWRLPATEPGSQPGITPADDACFVTPDRSWLARPPQLVPVTGGAVLLFSRIAPETDDDHPTLELATLAIDKYGTCEGALKITKYSDLPAAIGRKELRGLPVIVGELDGDSALDVVLPNDPPIRLCTLQSGKCLVQ